MVICYIITSSNADENQNKPRNRGIQINNKQNGMISPANLRPAFQLITKDVIHWFPGHMNKGLKQMQQKLKAIDCVVEVHDARIPLSGRNPEFKYTVSGLKPHILVLNKKDLISVRSQRHIAERIKAEEGIEHVVFTNCKNQQCDGVRRIIPLAQELITGSNRYHRSDQPDSCMMIIGVPNVGKSSLVNILRNRHLHKRAASAVGGVAGITRSVLHKIKISEEPLIYLLDTPGILAPTIKDTETGMKLALCACLQDHLVGPDLIADFLLFWLNRNERFEYVELMGLDQPTDAIGEVLLSGAKQLDKYRKVRNFDGSMVMRPDFEAAAFHMLKAFRRGDLGKVNLDREYFK